MTPNEALSYLLDRRPGDFTPAADRMHRLMAALGDPQKRLRFVHVAGTNGKGSTACLIASALSAAGFKTGLYTSPHLVNFSERIRINNEEIDPGSIARLAARVKAAEEALALEVPAFDRMTAVAFLWFAEQACDIVVLEVGLGGTLDATNVIDSAEVSVITHIGLDHTEVLGDTPAEIAAQKAGIIKEGGTVVLYPQEDAVCEVIRSAAEKKHAKLIKAEARFDSLSRTGEHTRVSCRGLGRFNLGLPGEIQLVNASVAYAALCALREKGFDIPNDAIIAGFSRAKWPARFERVHTSPVVILDGGHNPQCAEALVYNLKAAYGDEKIVFLLGMLSDKDIDETLSVLAPLAKSAVTVNVDNPRTADAHLLAEKLGSHGIWAEPAETLPHAIQRVLRLARGGVVCAFGSMYLSGQVREYFHKS